MTHLVTETSDLKSVYTMFQWAYISDASETITCVVHLSFLTRISRERKGIIHKRCLHFLDF